MSNDNKRRTFFRYMALLGMVSFSATPLFAKVTKPAAKYQETPNGGNKCSECTFFNPKDDSCTIVEGTVSADGWCVYFSKKQAAQP